MAFDTSFLSASLARYFHDNPAPSLIGEGNSRTVWKVYEQGSQCFKALARFRGPDLSEINDRFTAKQKAAYQEYETQKILSRIKQEIKVLQHLKGSPHIIQLDAVVHDGALPAFVTPYYEGGDLNKALEQGSLSTSQKTQIALDTLMGLIESHEKGIVINDLKPANILLTASMNAVLADLEIALPIRDQRQINENTYCLVQSVFDKMFRENDGPAYEWTRSFLQTDRRNSSISSREAFQSFKACSCR